MIKFKDNNNKWIDALKNYLKIGSTIDSGEFDADSSESNEMLQYRGLKANLPVLKEGQIGFCTDTKETWIGSSSGNERLVSYRIGDEIMTETNVNPSTDFGGTWELFDKGFKKQTLVIIKDEYRFFATLNNNVIKFRVFISNSEVISTFGGTSPLAYTSIDLKEMGISTLSFNNNGIFASNYSGIYYGILGISGEGQLILYKNLATEDWGINCDVSTYITEVVDDKDNMIDSFCDKFYWRKVS